METATKSQKEDSGSSNVKHYSGALVLIVVALWLAAIVSTRANEEPKPEPRTVQEIEQSYWERHRNKPVIYRMQRVAATQQPWEETQKWVAEIETALAKYRDTSTLSKKIHARFGKLYATQYMSGYAFTLHPDPQGLVNQLKQDSIMMILVPKDQYEKEQALFPSPLLYRSEWNAIMSVMVEQPTDMFVALLYHELGHAYKDMVADAEFVTASDTSDKFDQEEVEMFELEYDILNRASQGQLAELYQKIIARAGEKNNPTLTLSLVTPEDLQHFESMFGLENASTRMATLYLAQFYMGLGFELFTGTPDARRLKHIQYRHLLASKQ